MTSSSPGPARVSLRRVNRTFGTHTVLRDVDVEIDPGQVIALLGSSGSGKSTLLRPIAGLGRPTELIVTTITHDHQDRVRSYQLLAEEWARR
jgi:sulfonate transport system ATP-binding protein